MSESDFIVFGAAAVRGPDATTRLQSDRLRRLLADVTRSDPLHVAIGVLCGVTGGPASYGIRLVRSLVALDRGRVTVVTDRPEPFADVADSVVAVPMRGGLDRLRWQHVALPRALGPLRPDVFHDTKNAVPGRYRGAPLAVTVHDLAYYTVPDSFGWASRTFLRRATATAVRRAARVVVPSAATGADVAARFPAAADRVRVVLHGIDPAPAVAPAARQAVRARYGLTGPYVLHVGTIQARKNVDLVVRAVRELRGRGLPHRCVVVGRRGWLADAAFAEIERDDTAVHVGHVADDELAALYAEADAFVSPSAYEGFGFAVADALAHGVPTVISDVSSLPEVCGDAALRLPTLSADAIVATLEPVLRDADVRARLAAAGRARAAEFGWDRAARSTWSVYEECAASRARSAARPT